MMEAEDQDWEEEEEAHRVIDALLRIRSDMDSTFRDATLKAPLWEHVSSKQGPFTQVELKDGSPNKQKHCNCKNSKCLKLYCECFASGSYCNGCNCLNYHNNLEKETA